jgi:hypothetical protein
MTVKEARILDSLRWVAQEARAAVMLGWVESPNHETLRKALASLERAFNAEETK